MARFEQPEALQAAASSLFAPLRLMAPARPGLMPCQFHAVAAGESIPAHDPQSLAESTQYAELGTCSHGPFRG